MTRESILLSMKAHRDRRLRKGGHPGFWLSVNSVPGWDVDAVARHANLPNGKMRVSTAGAIVAAGWTIRETPGRREVNGHCDVWRTAGDESEPTAEELDSLIAAFGEPIENPARIGRRGR